MIKRIFLLMTVCFLSTAMAENNKPSRFYNKPIESPVAKSVLKAGQAWGISQQLPSGQVVQAKVVLDQPEPQKKNSDIIMFSGQKSGVFFDQKRKYMGIAIEDKEKPDYVHVCIGKWNGELVKGFGLYLPMDTVDQAFDDISQDATYNPDLFKKFLDDKKIPHQNCIAELQSTH